MSLTRFKKPLVRVLEIPVNGRGTWPVVLRITPAGEVTAREFRHRSGNTRTIRAVLAGSFGMEFGRQMELEEGKGP